MLQTLLVAFCLSLLLTHLVRRVARRRGFVTEPRKDRWNPRPTPFGGGVAVFAATAVACWMTADAAPRLLALALGGAAVFAVGLADDLAGLRPTTKLSLLAASAVVAVLLGLRIAWTGHQAADLFLTVFWLTAVTNAFNLVDNIDGACAGIGAISAAVITLIGLVDGRPAADLSTVASALAAALLGFLVYNFPPASIFLGDAGSLFAGFVLAGVAGEAIATAQPLGVRHAVPVLVLAVPIFDMVLVTLARRLVGRPVLQGGTDHTAHRLVALGLSEPHAVLLLYGMAVLAGATALVVSHGGRGALLLAFLTVAMVALAVLLLRAPVYRASSLEHFRHRHLEAPDNLAARLDPATVGQHGRRL